MFVCVSSADVALVILSRVELCVMLLCGRLDDWTCLARLSGCDACSTKLD